MSNENIIYMIAGNIDEELIADAMTAKKHDRNFGIYISVTAILAVSLTALVTLLIIGKKSDISDDRIPDDDHDVVSITAGTETDKKGGESGVPEYTPVIIRPTPEEIMNDPVLSRVLPQNYFGFFLIDSNNGWTDESYITVYGHAPEKDGSVDTEIYLYFTNNSSNYIDEKSFTFPSDQYEAGNLWDQLYRSGAGMLRMYILHFKDGYVYNDSSPKCRAEELSVDFIQSAKYNNSVTFSVIYDNYAVQYIFNNISDFSCEDIYNMITSSKYYK